MLKTTSVFLRLEEKIVREWHLFFQRRFSRNPLNL